MPSTRFDRGGRAVARALFLARPRTVVFVCLMPPVRAERPRRPHGALSQFLFGPRRPVLAKRVRLGVCRASGCPSKASGSIAMSDAPSP
eukprot:10648314-Lingulodinium_polyedra.AAC.1